MIVLQAAVLYRKKDDEVGRLIDQVTSEISSSVESVRMKQGQLKQKEHQMQQLRTQVLSVALYSSCRMGR